MKQVRAWIIDLLLVAMASLLATVLRQDLEISAREFSAFMPLLISTLVAAAIINPMLGLHRAVWRFSGRADYLAILAASALIIFVSVSATFAFNRLEGIPRALPIRQALLIFLLLSGARFFMQVRHANRPRKGKQFAFSSHPLDEGWTVLLGVNPLTELYLRAANNLGDHGTRIAGLLADGAHQAGRLVRRHPILGTPEKVAEILEDLEIRGIRVDRIVISTRWTQLSPTVRGELRRLEGSSSVELLIMAEALGFETAEGACAAAAAFFEKPPPPPPREFSVHSEARGKAVSGGHETDAIRVDAGGSEQDREEAHGQDGGGAPQKAAGCAEGTETPGPCGTQSGRLATDAVGTGSVTAGPWVDRSCTTGAKIVEPLGAVRHVPGVGACEAGAAADPTLHVSADERQQLASRAYWRWKRYLDVLGAFGLGIVLLPLILSAALLVLIDVGRPVLFWQHRPGVGGRSFRLYKLRTMSRAHDPNGRRRPERERSTNIGRFLRATRLDELPQLYHILMGDMSFVGPRPLLPVDQPFGFTARLLVRPGLTGWAQVHGGRTLSAWDKARQDVWYIRHASFKLDVAILIRTAWVVLRGEGTQPSAPATPIATPAKDLIATGSCDRATFAFGAARPQRVADLSAASAWPHPVEPPRQPPRRRHPSIRSS